MMATLFGMALGGWMSGAIFDLTGSYQAAFVNGIAWNLLNIAIAGWLLRALDQRIASPRRAARDGRDAVDLKFPGGQGATVENGRRSGVSSARCPACAETG